MKTTVTRNCGTITIGRRDVFNDIEEKLQLSLEDARDLAVAIITELPHIMKPQFSNNAFPVCEHTPPTVSKVILMEDGKVTVFEAPVKK